MKIKNETDSRWGVHPYIQKFGGFINGMVVPNISVFLAWGILGALFLNTGWIPNERYAALVRPISIYLIPLMIAFMGGKMIDGDRGGTAGALGTIGLIIGSGTPMFLGAMIIGPFTAFLVKRIRLSIIDRVPRGFEMLTENFVTALIGLGMCLISNTYVEPLFLGLNRFLIKGVHILIARRLLPLLAVINEPAKALFLNNVIDQGIYYPIGMEDALDGGKSIFFMVASNPGAGLGLLMAYAFFASGDMKKTAPGAMIIHFLGGIHEMYIPYVLIHPLTLIGMIAGSATGILVFLVTGVGLTAGPSPGSFFSYLILTPKGDMPGMLTGISAACMVSFIINSVLLKLTWEKKKETEYSKKEEELIIPTIQGIRRVAFACDMGLGSSVMGAVNFRKRLLKAGVEIEVGSYAIEQVPPDTQIIVTQENFSKRARAVSKDAEIITIRDFIHDPNIDILYERILEGTSR